MRSTTSTVFELPPILVEQEFAAVWSQVEGEMKNDGKTFADEDTTEEEAQAEYRRIAERRVRLGLVLAQIGEKADIKVSDDEVTQALIERVRQYPGQERQVWEFYQKNPQALAEIRAPLFEEKVVDHILVPGEGGRGDRSRRRRSSATMRPRRPIRSPRAARRRARAYLEASRSLQHFIGRASVRPNPGAV